MADPRDPRAPILAMVVDDEPLARADLVAALAERPGWRVVASCASAVAARDVLAGQTLDVVFLDIRMPGESGLTLARELMRTADPPVVVFVTAFDRFAIEAFAARALDYLLKPVTEARLDETLERVRALVGLRQRDPWLASVAEAVDAMEAEARPAPPLTRLCVRSVGRVESVPLAAVRWIASAGNYVELHLATRTILHRTALATLERHLDPGEFLRAHRTAIVRRSVVVGLRVTGDGTHQLILDRGETLPVSGRYLPAVRELVGDQTR